ncbi:MAG: hypothetical protein V4505_17700 [Pseudomonadota bacterium]
MKTATDIAENLAPQVYPLLEAQAAVHEALRQGGGGRRRGHVIDAASFDHGGLDITFDGEFDFHLGSAGDQAGHPALRVNVSGHMAPGADGGWEIASLAVESIRIVDASSEPDEL